MLQVTYEGKYKIQVLTQTIGVQWQIELCHSRHWTSPNHKAYVAIVVHLEQNGEPLAMLLDFVEVPKLHMGSILTLAFVKVLKDFGISDKVNTIYLNK